MIYCKCISKSYKGNQVIDDFSYEFSSKITYLNGSNGSGKSTLIRILAQIEKPDIGTVTFSQGFHRNICSLSTDSIQPPEIFTLNELYAIQCQYNDVDYQLLRILLEKLQLTKFLNVKFNDLSTGTKKKFSVISALIKKSKILLLDEPFNGLDSSSIAYFADIINNDQRHQIIVDHLNILPFTSSVSL